MSGHSQEEEIKIIMC